MAQDNTKLMETILDFYDSPEILLSDREAIDMANRLLQLDPTNERAKKTIASNR
jgi:hypothetical protein